jgi:hypothetical protein
LGFVVVEVVVVVVVEVEVEVVEVVVEVDVEEDDVVYEFEGIVNSILVDEMLGIVSTGGMFFELDGKVSSGAEFVELNSSGGAVLTSGTGGSASKVVNSCTCFISAILVVGAKFSLVLAGKNH